MQGAQSRTTRQEREDTAMGSRRMSRKLIAGDRHYCSRSSIRLELCQCQQGPLIRMLDAGGCADANDFSIDFELQPQYLCRMKRSLLSGCLKKNMTFYFTTHL